MAVVIAACTTLQHLLEKARAVHDKAFDVFFVTQFYITVSFHAFNTKKRFSLRQIGLIYFRDFVSIFVLNLV